MKKPKKGDLVRTRKGNIALLLSIEELGLYYSIQFVESGIVRTGFHCSNIAGVVSESR